MTARFTSVTHSAKACKSLKAIPRCCHESHKAAVAAWVNDGGKVDATYFNKQITVLDDRLALAGLRLAALLDDTFKGEESERFQEKLGDSRSGSETRNG